MVVDDVLFSQMPFLMLRSIMPLTDAEEISSLCDSLSSDEDA
jgi:hypothetical protein